MDNNMSFDDLYEELDRAIASDDKDRVIALEKIINERELEEINDYDEDYLYDSLAYDNYNNPYSSMNKYDDY